MAKIGLDVQVDISPPSTLRQSISTGKVSFSERAGLLIIPMRELSIPILQ
jgi:peptide/nickel transport system substrate-binding protein